VNSGKEHFAALIWSFLRRVEVGVCSIKSWFKLVIARTCAGKGVDWTGFLIWGESEMFSREAWREMREINGLQLKIDVLA
jgi:hypothetical protein